MRPKPRIVPKTRHHTPSLPQEPRYVDDVFAGEEEKEKDSWNEDEFETREVELFDETEETPPADMDEGGDDLPEEVGAAESDPHPAPPTRETPLPRKANLPPFLNERRKRTPSPAPVFPPAAPLPPAPRPAPRQRTAPAASPPPAPQKLRAVIAKNQPLPPFSLILGLAGDDRPLVMDLLDPSTGALLIVGDRHDANRRLLETVLGSACLLNIPSQAQIDLITPHPDAFTALMMEPHLNQIVRPNEPEVFRLLERCFGWVEARQKERQKKQAVKILAIDQIDLLAAELAPESLAYLRWLIRRGPASGLWMIATLPASKIFSLDAKTVRAFGLLLAGHVRQPHTLRNVKGIPPLDLAALIPGEEACLQLDSETIRFRIPAFA